MNARYLVVSADDLGLQYGFNEAILQARSLGALTSTSIRANGLALDHALDTILPQCPGLGVGAHLCLSEGKALSPPASIRPLVDSSGHFRFTEARAYAYLYLNGHNSGLRQAVERELRSQLEFIMARVRLDHVNSHHHSHMIPWIFKIVLRLAEEYGIPFIRLTREPFVSATVRVHSPGIMSWLHFLNLNRWSRKALRQLARSKTVRSNTYFFGSLQTGGMSEDIALAYLGHPKHAGITEILFHPCLSPHALENQYVEPYMKLYCLHPNRRRELEAVCSPAFLETLTAAGYVAASFRDLAETSAS